MGLKHSPANVQRLAGNGEGAGARHTFEKQDAFKIWSLSSSSHGAVISIFHLSSSFFFGFYSLKVSGEVQRCTMTGRMSWSRDMNVGRPLLRLRKERIRYEFIYEFIIWKDRCVRGSKRDRLKVKNVLRGTDIPCCLVFLASLVGLGCLYSHSDSTEVIWA